MNCTDVGQKIEIFVLGELPKPEQAAVEEHLAVCPACKAVEGQYRLLVMQIKGTSEPDSVSPDFVRAVRSAVRAEIRAIAHRLRIRRIIAVTASAAACLLLASAIWHASVLERGPLRPSPEQAQGTKHGGRMSFPGAPPVSQVWQHRGALSVPGSMADGVVVRGQNMYLLQQSGQQTHVAALDTKTGRQNWLSDVQGSGHILADDSRVYCLAPGEAGKLDLVALDAADGKTLWRFPQPGLDPLPSPCRPTLMVPDRICWSADTTVQMLGCAGGELIWTRSVPDDGSLSAPVLVNNEVYVANAGGLYCLNSATGDESWSLAYSGVKTGRDRPLLTATDAEVYASLHLGLAGSRLICMDLAEHRIRWSRDVPRVTHLYADGDRLYLRDQNVQALDRTTGQLLWTCAATGCNPVTYAEGLAYFVDSREQGRLVALDTYTGSKVWELGGMKSCNAFIKIDGTGYVKTLDGVVHAIAFKG